MSQVAPRTDRVSKERRVLNAALRLFRHWRERDQTFGRFAMVYGPKHQALWRACSALEKGKR
jgi:hypothetical protein